MYTGSNDKLKVVYAEIEKAFESDFYVLIDEARSLGMTAVEHYIKLGETKGARPCRQFDPVYYARQNPDVTERGFNLFWHYLTYGKAEGRLGALPTIELDLPTARLEPSKATLIVLLHEATRTGAPILGWNIIKGLNERYNVIVVVMQGGAILSALKEMATEVVEVPSGIGQDVELWASVAEQLKVTYNPPYVIANSSATHRLAVALESVNVPVVALIHEFASDMHPFGVLNGLYQSASKIVFSARVIEENSREIYSALRGRPSFIVPQGQCRVPVFSQNGVEDKCTAADNGLNAFRNGAFSVVGIGTVTYRKGPDLFVSVADYLVNYLGFKDVKFIWIGVHIPADARYRTALDLQIRKCGLESYVEFIGEVDNLDSFYANADVLFVSSRIDPLPNVGIDAMIRGLPIVCFDGASGFSEILSRHPTTSSMIAPYANVARAAEIINRIAHDGGVLRAASDELRNRAAKLFDMARYIQTIEELGRDACREMSVADADIDEILKAGVFEKDFCFGETGKYLEDHCAVAKYVGGSRRSWPLARPFTGTFIRRPMVGFNPLIYDMHMAPGGKTKREPFADFIMNGQPSGPWLHKVVRPTDSVVSGNLKAALHGHFHYPELLDELINAIHVNSIKPDLFLTTTSAEKVHEINAILERRGGMAANVWIVPNQGRDILSFIKDMPAHLSGYDIVGHVHGKKSAHVASETGNRWRDFMWQNLVGGHFAMLDKIAGAFAQYSEIGLIFPEDPHLNGWDFNEPIATDLAVRLGAEIPLPLHFDFPIGTMFWARPEALRPVFDMPLLPDEIPQEPLPIDGTVLHAIERIIPFAVGKAGYSYATTHVPGVYR